MLYLCGIWITPSLPSLPGPLSTGVAELDKVLSIGQIEMFYIKHDCKEVPCSIEVLEIELLGHLTVCTQKTDI